MSCEPGAGGISAGANSGRGWHRSLKSADVICIKAI